MTYPISNSSWRSHASNHIKRYTIALSLLVLFMVSFGKFISYLHWDFDDSFIIYRIVNNILQGNGWVYNINENHNPSTSVLNTVLVSAYCQFFGLEFLYIFFFTNVLVTASPCSPDLSR